MSDSTTLSNHRGGEGDLADYWEDFEIGRWFFYWAKLVSIVGKWTGSFSDFCKKNGKFLWWAISVIDIKIQLYKSRAILWGYIERLVCLCLTCIKDGGKECFSGSERTAFPENDFRILPYVGNLDYGLSNSLSYKAKPWDLTLTIYDFQ